MLLHSLGLVYKSMRGMMTNSVDRDQWLNVTKKNIFYFFDLLLLLLLLYKQQEFI
jgi:hypothetical protein